MWKIERKPAWPPSNWVRPWYWEVFFSSAGYADGEAWTKRRAEDALLRAQGWLLAE